LQAVAQVDQVMRIQPGVRQQRRRQRPLAPVGALEAFVELDTKLFFEQTAQPDPVSPEDAAGDHGVEQIAKREAKIALETDQIVLGGVKNFLDVRIGKQSLQGTEIVQREWIDQVIVAGIGELNQTDLFAVGEQAVRFG